ncbi:MAG: hypothetical protein R3B84_08290 [Zavarzinella sp.]
MARKLLLGIVAIAALYAQTGCALINQYPGDPNERMNVLINQSEDLRQARLEWGRFWQNHQPSTMTYERVNGSIGP